MRNPIDLPSIERLHELFHYNSSSGSLTRKITVMSTAKSGMVVGTVCTHGYLKVRVDWQSILCHRIAWAMHYGEWPVLDIDHINSITNDNSIGNLRLATQKQNQQNRKKSRSNSKSGLLGASVLADGRFMAAINVDGKKIRLGSFKTAEAAHQAYMGAKNDLHKFSTINGVRTP